MPLSLPTRFVRMNSFSRRQSKRELLRAKKLNRAPLGDTLAPKPARSHARDYVCPALELSFPDHALNPQAEAGKASRDISNVGE